MEFNFNPYVGVYHESAPLIVLTDVDAPATSTIVLDGSETTMLKSLVADNAPKVAVKVCA